MTQCADRYWQVDPQDWKTVVCVLGVLRGGEIFDMISNLGLWNHIPSHAPSPCPFFSIGKNRLTTFQNKTNRHYICFFALTCLLPLPLPPIWGGNKHNFFFFPNFRSHLTIHIELKYKTIRMVAQLYIDIYIHTYILSQLFFFSCVGRSFKLLQRCLELCLRI